MPARQPFTALCQASARSRVAGRADLHLHTTHSDGTYTPAQILDLARRSGLAVVAITDHDTLAGVAEAEAAARGSGVKVVPGVEISAEHEGRELHLLGYFVQSENAELRTALQRLREGREQRFWYMVERLRGCGVSIDECELRRHAGAGVLGRRNLAEYLVQTRRASTVREAFARYLGDKGRVNVPKVRLAVAEAIALVRGAGGVASWAHPPYDDARDRLRELQRLGLGAVEVEYPGFRPGHKRELRRWAAELGLAISGGSDCHGPGHARRTVGACSISAQELAALRRQAEFDQGAAG
jgi:predicted metal-dependent phosphoesterase TrpH